MKLPNADLAVVDERKLRDYLLSWHHPRGRDKAAFLATLGFSRGSRTILRSALIALASECEVEQVVETPFRQKYVVHGKLRGPTGRSATVVSVWLVRVGDKRPRLVTVYPRQP